MCAWPGDEEGGREGRKKYFKILWKENYKGTTSSDVFKISHAPKFHLELLAILPEALNARIWLPEIIAVSQNTVTAA